MKKIKLWILSLSVLFLAACEKASETLVKIPNVNVECLSSTSQVCSTINNGKPVRIIMTRSGCSNFAFEPVATSSTQLICTSNGCTATLSQWFDDNQNAITEILTGSMSLCGLIDLDSDFNEDSGEMEHSSDISIRSSAPLQVNDWSQI